MAFDFTSISKAATARTKTVTLGEAFDFEDGDECLAYKSAIDGLYYRSNVNLGDTGTPASAKCDVLLLAGGVAGDKVEAVYDAGGGSDVILDSSDEFDVGTMIGVDPDNPGCMTNLSDTEGFSGVRPVAIGFALEVRSLRFRPQACPITIP